jgi:hypothetical protein
VAEISGGRMSFGRCHHAPDSRPEQPDPEE